LKSFTVIDRWSPNTARKALLLVTSLGHQQVQAYASSRSLYSLGLGILETFSRNHVVRCRCCYDGHAAPASDPAPREAVVRDIGGGIDIATGRCQETGPGRRHRDRGSRLSGAWEDRGVLKCVGLDMRIWCLPGRSHASYPLVDKAVGIRNGAPQNTVGALIP
jgi:hypothetical protein